jgi:diguanylate cyclase (GGDEF)-like protein
MGSRVSFPQTGRLSPLDRRTFGSTKSEPCPIQRAHASDRMADPESSTTAAGTFSPLLQSLNDPNRLDALRRSKLLDGASTPALDRLTRIASALLDVPVSLVSLVDNAGQHFPGLTGLGGWAGDRRGTALSHSFCQHVVTSNAPLVIDNSQESSIVADNLAISRLGVVAYAGVPLRTSQGHTLGALCAIDGKPKAWAAEEIAMLEDLARMAMAEIEGRIADGRAEKGPPVPQDAYDSLTGLFNGRGFLQRGSELHATMIGESRSYSMVALDIDGFTAFNAEYGYAVGNDRLMELGNMLVEMAGSDNDVGRIGIDEFAVLLPDMDADGVTAFEARLHRLLESRNATHPTGEKLQVSTGCSTTVADSGTTFAVVLQRAEIAMYQRMGSRLRHAATRVG